MNDLTSRKNRMGRTKGDVIDIFLGIALLVVLIGYVILAGYAMSHGFPVIY